MDYESTDKYATRMARAAVESDESWSIADVCRATEFPFPVTSDDCVSFARMCNVPKRAEFVEAVCGEVKDGPRAGQSFVLARHRVPDRFADGGTEFVTVEGPDTKRCFRYSGKHLAEAAQQIQQFRDHLAGGE